MQQRQAFRDNKFTNTVSNDISDPATQGYEKRIKLKLAYKSSTRIILFHISGSFELQHFFKTTATFFSTIRKKNAYFLYFLMTRFLFFELIFYLCIYLFIFGCIGSSLLCAGFLYLWRAGATLCCGVRASHHGGFSCCRAWASVVVARGLSSCGAWA